MDDDNLSRRYLVSCGCGHELRIAAGQAGTVIRCGRCRTAIVLPRLSHLRRTQLVSDPVHDRGAFQFSLQTLLGLVAYCAMFLVAGKAVGFLWLFAMMPVCAVIGVLGAVAPRPVLYGSVLGGVFLLMGTLGICSVARVREDARQTRCTNDLKELGLGWQHAERYRRGVEQTEAAKWVQKAYRPLEQANP